jgi:hypothetical protein
MPYKDPNRKKEWELHHRSQRLARRRELRQIEAARLQNEPQPLESQRDGLSFLLPVIAGGALAAYSPKLTLGAGGATLLVAGIYKKGWQWWAVGVLLVVLAALFLSSGQDDQE